MKFEDGERRGYAWIFPDGRFQKIESIAIGEGTNATEEREEKSELNKCCNPSGKEGAADESDSGYPIHGGPCL